MKLDIPAGIFDGYIFDLDGTLIDTMPIHFRAWDEALRQLGNPKPLSRELFYSLAGVPTRKVAEQLIREYQLRADPSRLFHLKEELFVKKLDFVEPIDAVVEFARAVAKSHPVAVASGGPREVVQHSLKLSGLDALFPSSSAPTTWSTASRRRTCSCSRRSAWASLPRAAWCSRTASPASARRPRRECRWCASRAAPEASR